MPSVAVADHAVLAIEDVTACLPGGRPLIEDLRLHLDPGQALLVTGASGIGKTTLLGGTAIRRDHALFLSQQPYVPLGSLRGALTYPQSSGSASDEKVRQVLRTVQLGHLED